MSNVNEQREGLAIEMGRYARSIAIREQFFKEQLESALRWVQDDVKAIHRSLEAGSNVYADNIVAQAARVQDAALKYRLAREHGEMVRDILAANEPTKEPTK